MARVVDRFDIEIVVAPVFATNCCVVRYGDDAVVVDPGAGVAREVMALFDRTPGLACHGVLATHWHPDHTWDAAELCESLQAPLYINEADAPYLADPLGALRAQSAESAQVVNMIAASAAGLGFGDYRAPTRVSPFTTTPSLQLGTIELGLIHAPGHTEGSTLYLTPDAVLTGDVLFRDGVGRTDLPGGNQAVMEATLHSLASVLDPALKMIPGHGPSSTISRELASNPYLRMALS